MKSILIILSALFLILASVSVAHAVTCAKGVYRAGCAGSNGAVVTNKPAVVAPRGAVVVTPKAVAPRPVVVTPAPRCVLVNGRQVCR